MSDSQPLTPDDVQLIKSRIHSLQESLQQQLPNYATILKEIHENLKKDAAAVVLLTEDEIAVICAGLSKHTGVVITTQAAKKNTGVKSLKKLTLDDLF